MPDILNSYIPKFLVDLKRNNEDVIKVSTKYLANDGYQYELVEETVSPSLTQTTQSLQELQPEISNVFPFKTVTPIQTDGSTLILTPSADTIPTASQGYYVPIYFERYSQTVIRNIDKTFTELTV
jgi:hypothetical protein